MLKYLGGLVDGLSSTVTGLTTTARYAVENWGGQGKVTIQYPEQPAAPTTNFRGHLYNDNIACVVCNGCAKVCPVDCFTIVGERNELGRLRVSRFDIDLSKCISCGLCVRACGSDSLMFTQDFTTAPERHAEPAKQRWLFRVRADQMGRVLDSTEVAKLKAIGSRPREELTPDELAFLDTVEDPEHGTMLVARFGLGMYTSEEKQRVEAAREAEKQRKAAEAAAKEAAKKKAEAELKAKEETARIAASAIPNLAPGKLEPE